MRSDDTDKIARLFQAGGWSTRQLQPPSPLDMLAQNPYALVGIALSGSVDAVLERWRAAQEWLDGATGKDIADPAVDAYLLFVVPRIESRYDELREMLGDTYVCRKLCIETENRTIEESLADLPFFGAPAEVSQPSDEAIAVDDGGASGLPLTRRVLNDLARAGAETILQRLLLGEYEEQGASNED